MRQRLPLAGLPSTPAFTRVYLDDFARVAEWFDYNPRDERSIGQRLAELDGRSWPDLSASAEIAAGQQERWGADSLAVDNARALGQPQSYMVVTGQQPGLFGGPLYSQLKALTAVLLARRLSAQHSERRFIPVYWIASADSDFDEVSRTTVIGGACEPSKFALRQDKSQDGRMLNRREVDIALLAALIDELEAGALPQGLYRADVLAALRAAYCPAGEPAAGSLVRGFARWLARLFRGSGLVVLDPEELLAQRPDLGAIYARQIEQGEQGAAALEERGAALEEAGFSLQAEAAPADSHVFYVDEQGFRDKLSLPGPAEVTGKRSGLSWSRSELAQLARREPGRFTGSVLLRPVVEDALFPAAAWIGGSAELAYRAQSTALFAVHGRRHAPAYLRQHATVLTGTLAQALGAAGYEFDDLPPDPQAWRSRVAAEQLQPAAVRELLAGLDAANAELDRLIAQVPWQLPELARSMQSKLANSGWLHRSVARKVNAAMLRRQTDSERRLLAAQAMAFPLGKPQERLLNLLSFLPRTGLDGMLRMLDQLEAPCWEHCLIMFD